MEESVGVGININFMDGGYLLQVNDMLTIIRSV